MGWPLARYLHATVVTRQEQYKNNNDSKIGKTNGLWPYEVKPLTRSALRLSPLARALAPRFVVTFFR